MNCPHCKAPEHHTPPGGPDDKLVVIQNISVADMGTHLQYNCQACGKGWTNRPGKPPELLAEPESEN